MRHRLTPIAALVAVSALSFVAGLSSSIWLRALFPQVSVAVSYRRDARLHSLGASPTERDPARWDPPGVDPWGEPWRVVHISGVSGFGYSFFVYSTGPNGSDEGGHGDDLWPTQSDEFPRFPDISKWPSWPVLYLDLLLMLGVPGALWWTWSVARLWSSPRQSLAREASLCVVIASAPSLGLAWRIDEFQQDHAIPASVSQPFVFVDPAIALALTGALVIVLATAALRSWRWTRLTPPD